MAGRSDSLRVCGLALVVFLVAAVPAQWLVAGPWARLVLGGSSLLVAMTGPSEDVVRGGDGRPRTIDRRAALERFWNDPGQQPRLYGLVAVWSWIAVAPLLGWWARLRHAARAALLVAATYVVAMACNAVAWYWRSMVVSLAAPPPRSPLDAGIEALGTTLTIVALFVLPVALGLAAYPGLRLGPPPDEDDLAA
jgi:hypothetical protein